MSNYSSKEIFNKIKNVIGDSNDLPIVLHEPCFKKSKAKEYLSDCLDTGWVSSSGEWVKIFEEKISKFTGRLLKPLEFCILLLLDLLDFT